MKKSPEISNWYAALGRIGSRARAKKLSPERRKQIAQIAARKRWGERKTK